MFEQVTLPHQSTIHLSILHFNDVYEITPVSGGTLGGLARVATLCKQLRQKNPNTLVTFAGDFYNPSAIGTAIIEGEALDGKQTLAVMNKIGIDYMTFGDHEINTVNHKQFLERIAATTFKIVSSNIFDSNHQPFTSGNTTVLERDIVVVDNIRIGVLGLTKTIRFPTINFTYQAIDDAVSKQITFFKEEKIDILIALTHQSLTDDKMLVAKFPEIDLVLGGDEHQYTRVINSQTFTPIYKSDSNARSVYLLDLFFDTVSKKLYIEDNLYAVTDAVANDAITQQEVSYWQEKAFTVFRAQGWEPTEVITKTKVALDGFDSSIRHGKTAFTELITASMLSAADNAELALICSWAIRLDDYIPVDSEITRYDILRIFPDTPSPIYTVNIRGDFLIDILEFSERNKGSGSYLLSSSNVEKVTIAWKINTNIIVSTQNYRVAIADDLLHDYLTYIDSDKTKTVTVLKKNSTLHHALIQQFRK